MKDWEKYEKQIFDKLGSEFPNCEITKNKKLKGIFSKKNRQIDIYVKGKVMNRDVSVVIDCKKFSKNVDIKTVESFIAFTEDIGCNMGILMTNVGYTSGAKSRIENYYRDIRLEIIEYKDFEEFYFNWFICNPCIESGNPIAREIRWDGTSMFEYEGLIQIVDLGSCEYCNTSYVRCQGCGLMLELPENLEVECMCGLTFFVITNKEGEYQVVVKSTNNSEEKQIEIDPNQLNLFE